MLTMNMERRPFGAFSAITATLGWATSMATLPDWRPLPATLVASL